MEHFQNYSTDEELGNVQLDWEKTVTNNEMTWVLKLWGKDFDFIKVVDFTMKNIVHNEMISHTLTESVCEMHIW